VKGEQEGAAPLKQGRPPIIDSNYPARRSADTASTEEFSDDQKQPMLSHSPAPPDDNESIRHVYFSLYFWITLETHFRQPTRYSVRQLIVELAATGDYFEHHLRLINRKGDIKDLAGKKTPTGQTALETELVFSKLDFKFWAH